MFLRCTNRKKDGKEHRYWNVVENRRVTGGRVVQRQVLYLGEINGSQRESWRKTIEVFEDGAATAQTMALFPEDCPVEVEDTSVVKIRLKEVELRRPRQWGACWLACTLYEQLGWISSGQSSWRRAARGRVGIWSLRRFAVIV